MGTYSIAEAKARLSELIDRAERGEGVVITRHGQVVAEIRAAAPKPKPITQADLDWLAERRAGRKLKKGAPNAVEQVRKMRDESWS